MDYTNFIKLYYKTIINKLNKFEHYSGTIVTLDYLPDIPSEYYHYVDANLDILPNFEVNINASDVYFERILQYMLDNSPDLAPVVLGTKLLRNFYEKNVLNIDDEMALERIKLYVDIAIDLLKQQGVIK